MVAPKGPDAARSGSTWIHWWSPVASANRFTCSWSITCHWDHPRCCPESFWSSSMLETVVVMSATLCGAPRSSPEGGVRALHRTRRPSSLEPDALVLAALGVEEQGEEETHEDQVDGQKAAEPGREQVRQIKQDDDPAKHDPEPVAPAALVGHSVPGGAEAQPEKPQRGPEKNGQEADDGQQIGEHHRALQRLGL